MPEDNKNQNQFLDKAVDIAQPTEKKRSIPVKEKPKGFKANIKDLFVNPKKRKIVIVSSLVIIFALFIVPWSRYFVLNTVGVRSSASVKVLDSSTQQPLKNVAVKIGTTEGRTNDDGIAKLEKLKLGTTKLQIEKRAFASVNRSITIGWGSNPLGESKLKPVGVQYSFDIKDFLSDKPIEKADASYGEYSAFSDQNGRVVLTIDKPGDDTITITIKARGYRDETINQNTDNKEVQRVAMVPVRKHVFVSKRSGKYDVYKIDVDNKNEQLVLSGTGNERDDMTLVPHPDIDVAALVSTRTNQRNNDGFLLSTLTLIDISGQQAQTSELATSEKIQIIGWSGNQLVYVKIASGASGDNPDRHRLITYNYDNGESKEIAKSNYFNDVMLAGDNIYYAPSNALQKTKIGFYKVNAKGENNKILFEQEVWNIFRTDYNKIEFSVQNDWYELSMTDDRVLASSGPPPIQLTRIYIDSPDKKNSLWIDQRDGKGVLLSYNSDSKEEKVIKTQSGLTYPARWVNQKTIVYRIATDQEVADYIVSIDGGEPKKITDVTNTGGVDRWYYY